MAKNIALDISGLADALELDIKKARTVNNDLGNAYFNIKTGRRNELNEAKMLFLYFDNASLRNDIIGEYLLHAEAQIENLQKLVAQLLQKGGG